MQILHKNNMDEQTVSNKLVVTFFMQPLCNIHYGVWYAVFLILFLCSVKLVAYMMAAPSVHAISD